MCAHGHYRTSGIYDFPVKTPDFKTSKNAPTSKHTLQLLMYYLMGKHSGIDIFKSITRIGFFNPRLNIAYVLDVKDVPDAILKAVEQDVIGY